jgi:hypothetical protein
MPTLLITCGAGHEAYTRDHARPGATLTCPGDSGCCQQVHEHAPDCKDDCAAVHDHDAAAHACKGNPGGPAYDPEYHAGQPCPFPPEQCPVYGGGYIEPSGNPEDPSGYMVKGQCPGGHCAAGVADCTVCRPVRILALPGSFGTLQQFGQAGS